MKIQCDVCTKDEASVFCTADEAALCDACDHRVHHANKLAGKHHRFSLLLPPSPNQFPLCDICKERRAFLFCQQDRAILCLDCDFPIHKANEHTQNHNRFLLTGVKLSATSALYSAAASDSVPDFKPQKGTQISIGKPVSVQPTAIPNPPTVAVATKTKAAAAAVATYSGSTSSISEYLIETLPGWRVEDLLDSPPPSFGFSKTVGDVLPIWDADLERNLSSFSPPAPPLFPSQYPFSDIAFGGQVLDLKESKENETTNNISSRKWRDDGCFIVPEISPPSTNSKRSRTFW